MRTLRYTLGLGTIALIAALFLVDATFVTASSHREAPMILNDPLADNTDVYAFRDPSSPSDVILVANYIPLELPSGGPNYDQWGEDVRYEIHVKNQTSMGQLGTATDDITYRFTFNHVNEDPTTFFKIRLGQENLKATYTLEKSTDGGSSFTTIVSDGFVPPPNVGPRSITADAGLGTTYEALTTQGIVQASTGETVFAGPRDDAFFVDLGGIFDLGGVRDEFCDDPANANCARDEVAGFNTHSIIMRVPISSLQKDGKTVDQATSILDGDFVIGVWASASRPQIKTLALDGGAPSYSGPWVQVSRLGMPLTNEAVIPIGEKDYWNAVSPYSAAEQEFAQYFVNPELALYMGNGAFGPAVPGLSEDLIIQKNSYPGLNLDGDGDPSNDGSGLDFTNGADGAAAVLPLVVSGALDVTGTAFAVPTMPTSGGSPTALLAAGQPRRVDILPIFYFGVPNLAPYQLAAGKAGLVVDDGTGTLVFAEGKPFINNFLPITNTGTADAPKLWGGDMLRLNMAVPVTARGTDEFRNNAYKGLIRAAAIGLTVPDFANATLQAIPHMDGFPNGRRLEDDVTTIALQAVGGLVLAAVGLPEDDATAGDYSDLASNQLVAELTFVAGPTQNDIDLRADFPYLANPHRGTDYVRDVTAEAPPTNTSAKAGLGIGAPDAFILNQNYPNPFTPSTTIEYHLSRPGNVELSVYDMQGRLVRTLVDEPMQTGTHPVRWDANGLASGTYLFRLVVDGKAARTQTATLVR